MRRLVLAAALAAVAGLTTTPAHAESFRGEDPARDVQRLTRSGDGDDYTAVPTRANPDITSIAVRHGRSKVVMTVAFDDIFVPPGPRGVFSVFGELRSDTRGASWDLWATQRARQGKVTIWRRGTRCTGSAKVDYARDRARVVLPRRCLGDPSWVSTSVAAWSQDDAFVWEDNGLQAGFLRDRYTPRLARG
ncbi:hypothetical protein [Nocardioides hwasunensis]|uniref:Uncharacterized protein n=1 Tax=Nocardioides hwasunensis TaxID=397258 RepID=A0ABR8MN40_9ACTN|nr:hypothetical protein [Nocardioides hwasunensis]MBD3915499.1 hypothetical protein [Nocardioides hwasunensis]